MRHSATRTLDLSILQQNWLRMGAAVCAIALILSATNARAEDDEDENTESFEQGILRNIATGLGGTGVENSGIQYRERSPLVIPGKTDLPPPATRKSTAAIANWPKDPDEAQRKAEAAANSKSAIDVRDAARPLAPSELAARPSRRAVRDNNSATPGTANQGNILSPSELGYNGGLFSNMFGSAKTETAPFKGEPTRDSLTQPPSGYQTPSPNYAYGSGKIESLNKEYNPAQGKY